MEPIVEISVDEDGEYVEYYPKNETGETILCAAPDGSGIITILPGEYLSDWTDVERTETHVPFVSVLSSDTLLTKASAIAVLLDSDSSFADSLKRYPIVPGTSSIYKATLSIGNVAYSDAFVEGEDSSLNIGYYLSSTIENEQSIFKELPIITETNDGLYYSDIYWKEVVPNDEDATNYFAGYCIDVGQGGSSFKLLFDGQALSAFNSFNVNRKHERIGIVDVSSTKSNQSFNDLYYFKTPENFERYSIRKTPISTHGKDFYTEKYSDIPGDIEKISLEGNVLYAIKNDKLYYTNENMFPSFEQIALPGYSVIDMKSCEGYTLVASSSIVNPDIVRIFRVVDGIVNNGIDLSNNSHPEYGSFGNLFHNGQDSVYIKTTTGIWTSTASMASLILEKTLDFTERNDVRGVFKNDDFFNSDVVVGDVWLYIKEKLYDFANEGYFGVEDIDEKITDIKTLSSDTAKPYVYFSTENDLYQLAIDDFDTAHPSFSTIEKKNNGIRFNSIKAFYFSQYGDLYIVDGDDLCLYVDFSPNKQLSDCLSSSSDDFLSGSANEKITISDFKDWTPAIVKSDSVNTIGTKNKILKLDIEETESETPGIKLIDGYTNENVYLYAADCLQKIISNNDDDLFSFDVVGTYDDRTIANSDSLAVDDSSETETSLWGVGVSTNNSVIQEILFQNGSASTITQHGILGTPTINSLFFIDGSIRLATSNDGPGIYKIIAESGFIVDPNNYITRDAESLGEDVSLHALEFFKGDYVLNYLDRGLLDDDENPVQRSLFKSSSETIQDDLNRLYVSNLGTAALASLFNRYIFVSDGGEGCVYSVHSRNGNKINFSQLELDANGVQSLTFLKESDGLGLLGYGTAFETFAGFSNIKIFDDVDEKYVALANNFKRGTRRIEVTDDYPDFLIGTTYGLKYVYDNIMTRSFYSSENNSSINQTINAIEKVPDASNTEFYLVGGDNVLFEVTSLKNAGFKKLYEFPSEKVLDIYAVQKNEYLIATTKGIYLTSLKYKFTNDLQKFTLDNIYSLINDELKKIIDSHIATDHKGATTTVSNPSLITKVNAKADNELSFISAEDKHVQPYDASIANAVKIIENDIIDTIVIGGEDPLSDSYVKVGIKNWALNSMQTKSTYTDDGFVNVFIDPTSGKTFDISTVPYIVKNWKSGLKEIYIYVPSTGTYYANNPQGISNSQYSYTSYARANVPNSSLLNTLPDACTTLRVYLYNSYFKIKTIVAAQCSGNSLPLKIYKDNVNADDAWKGVFDTVIQPSALRTLPMTVDANVNNVRNCTDEQERIYLDFSIYGTDAQAIRIIAES